MNATDDMKRALTFSNIKFMKLQLTTSYQAEDEPSIEVTWQRAGNGNVNGSTWINVN